MISDTDEIVLQKLEGHAGPIVRDFYDDENKALEYVNHRNSRIRFAALAVLSMKWGINQQTADLCEEMAVKDTDAQVRGNAVTCLSKYYEEKDNRRIGKLIATIVLNKNEVADVRRSAYLALFYLRKKSPPYLPNILHFRFPDDVDWDFTQSFLDAT